MNHEKTSVPRTPRGLLISCRGPAPNPSREIENAATLTFITKVPTVSRFQSFPLPPYDILRVYGEGRTSRLPHRRDQVLGARADSLQPVACGGRDHLLCDRISAVEVHAHNRFLPGIVYARGDRQRRLLCRLRGGHLCAGLRISRTLAALPQAAVSDRNVVRRDHHTVYCHGNVHNNESLISDTPESAAKRQKNTAHGASRRTASWMNVQARRAKERLRA